MSYGTALYVYIREKRMKKICIVIKRLRTSIIHFIYRLGWFFVFVIVCIYFAQFMGIQSYIVRSGSMEPGIPTGSICMVDTKYEFQKIRVNDVIAFRMGSNLVTHRVIQMTEDGLITKGDHNDVDDGLTTTEENYVGKNIMTIPCLGYILSWIQTIKGKITIVIFTLSIMVIQMIVREVSNEVT